MEVGVPCNDVEAEAVARYHRELGLLTSLYSTLEEQCHRLSEDLRQERIRRLRDLGDLDALRQALIESEALVARVRTHNLELDRHGIELDSQVAISDTRIAHLEAAMSAAALSPQVVRLVTLWRRLPGRVRRRFHELLDRVGSAVDRD